MMTLRARFIPEETRSTIINVFRIPLNFFVCVVLYNVHLFPLSSMFALCATFLAIACVLQVRAGGAGAGAGWVRLGSVWEDRGRSERRQGKAGGCAGLQLYSVVAVVRSTEIWGYGAQHEAWAWHVCARASPRGPRQPRAPRPRAPASAPDEGFTRTSSGGGMSSSTSSTSASGTCVRTGCCADRGVLLLVRAEAAWVPSHRKHSTNQPTRRCPPVPLCGLPWMPACCCCCCCCRRRSCCRGCCWAGPPGAADPSAARAGTRGAFSGGAGCGAWQGLSGLYPQPQLCKENGAPARVRCTSQRWQQTRQER